MGRRLANALPALALVAMVPLLCGCQLLFHQTVRVGIGVESAAPDVLVPSPESVESPIPARSPGPPPTVEELAALLGPDDFSAVGVTGAGAPTTNGVDGNAYIVYAGLSAGAGGIELDVSVLDTAEDAAAMVTDPGLFAVDAATKQDMGADLATIIEGNATNDGTGTFDTLRAQKGRLVFDLGIPTTATSRDQLIALAKLVLSRSADYQ